MRPTHDWNVISRTILPVIHQSDIFPGAGSQSGIGDTTQSLLFSPKAPTASGWIWGVGPIFLLPTGSNDLLGGEQWGAGPTAVALKQQGSWTYGGLANHVWSFAGDEKRSEISSTFVQPFVTRTWPGAGASPPRRTRRTTGKTTNGPFRSACSATRSPRSVARPCRAITSTAVRADRTVIPPVNS